MTNFESATHNTLLWRVPGQTAASMGRSQRVVEAIDIFPTLIDLVGIPAPPTCEGIDQPPSVECLQGESYAALFRGAAVNATEAASTAAASTAAVSTAAVSTGGKQHAFSQWPFPKWGPEKSFRMGYTVRSADGYRCTEYVPYDNVRAYRGDWSDSQGDDVELYDYNVRWC
jgi:hypothetical protein